MCVDNKLNFYSFVKNLKACVNNRIYSFLTSFFINLLLWNFNSSKLLFGQFYFSNFVLLLNNYYLQSLSTI